MIFENYTFEYPYAFLILILFYLCLKFCKAKGISFYFPNLALLQQASRKSMLLINSLKFLTILFLIIALASPIKEDNVVVRNDKGYEISLILDASGSMQEANKFNIVKDIVTDFVNKRENDRLGLSIFADFAYVAIPLTYDKNSIKRLLSKIDVGIAGRQRTALNEALFLSSNLFKTSKSKNKIAILLTDGMDNTNTIPLKVAIKTAKKYGIKVYTIGVGSVGDFNPAVLKEISSQTNAKFFHANTIQGLKDIYSTINKLEKSEIKADKYVKKTYFYQYFLAFALLFFLAYFYIVNKE
ncbi:vWA domain-containing protein [Poseidonibacter antarcticus]|uniref:vWA domain-containing protein n=1 Tax=Poseidonibacter antarcticus TaxID=2478538 RepID=UPI000EF52593|nr:VWA domain-containing protein [Poseidonibacter antarcticus]